MFHGSVGANFGASTADETCYMRSCGSPGDPPAGDDAGPDQAHQDAWLTRCSNLRRGGAAAVFPLSAQPSRFPSHAAVEGYAWC